LKVGDTTIRINDRDYMIDNLIDLVRIDSTNPSFTESSAGEGEIAHNDLKPMQNIGFDIETFKAEPGRVYVLGILNWTDTVLLDAAGVETAIIDPISTGLHTPP
jgi:hypothetical protein